MQEIYLKIFFESLSQNLLTGSGGSFLVKLSLLSGNPQIDRVLVLLLHILGFLAAGFGNFFFGFILGKLSLKYGKKSMKNNESQIQFANFLKKFGYIFTFIFIVFFNYHYMGQIFSMFFGYSFALLNIFKKQNQLKRFLIFFSITLICGKILNIYLLLKKS